MVRKIHFCPGEYYHIFNRGVQKSDIFTNDSDRVRFLFLILYLQAPITINNISTFVGRYIKHSVFNSPYERTVTAQKIVDTRAVELICFTLMPNHFHLLVREKEVGGVSLYLQRIQNAYSKYINVKYRKSGHVFQGPFRAVHIEDNEQLLYTSAYIHSNPRELKEWKKNFKQYPWSSFCDYIQKNRWEELLACSYLLDQYKSADEYVDSVLKSGAKLSEEEYDLLES